VDPVGALVSLAEAVENVGQELAADADARVLHSDFHLRLDDLGLDHYLPALGRELDGVGEQVPDDLLEAVGVALDGAIRRMVGESSTIRMLLIRRPDVLYVKGN
jgi:hypothetical protein